jgi:hypothetical protein
MILRKFNLGTANCRSQDYDQKQFMEVKKKKIRKTMLFQLRNHPVCQVFGFPCKYN